MPKLFSPSTLMVIALSAILCACNKEPSPISDSEKPQTVISDSQQRTLNNAKHMEEILQRDVESREQNMREQGI
ncbi:hypothetical protein [Zhongshania aquimaris]|uniref:Lipoprotein n=1 Tax=Zhongshania aquimaris TaxID=2857107 RepID=A0ABS6VU45_9GAMM|nr:hypothetical protein [Zhongshania aquimaris]MBW2941854.1 hypothetical protein [Zhongshania aquimaris]